MQARGLNGAEPLPTTLEQMAADYADEISKVQPTGPYRLLGWSIGGLVVHAVATEFQARGKEIALLAILDAYPNYALSYEDIKPSDQEILVAMLDYYDIRVDDEDEPLTIAEVAEILRQQGAPWRASERNASRPASTSWANNTRLGIAYVPAPFHGNMILFNSTIERPDDGFSWRTWAPFVDGEIESFNITSKHNAMTKPGPVAQIGAILADKLRELDGDGPAVDGGGPP